MQVEVAFATPDRQFLECIEVADGATVDDAIRNSDLARRFPEVDFEHLDVGIWGKPAPRDRVLAEGDRVEVYRALEMDPREARRLKAGI
jgi:putative ubiquitin-RnfH superfamily antitoxin RatB of RatAB toxin-antitoxin module